MSNPINDLIHHLSRLPGVGERTATRLAFHLLKTPVQYRDGFAQALQNLSKIHLCSVCSTVTNLDPCQTCTSPVRDRSILCVVEKPSDIYSIERLQNFRGLYHVLHGLLSPLEGIGPQDLRLSQLFDRLRENPPQEVILALSPTLEGEATMSFIVKQLASAQIQVSRLASGIAIGSDLEYADQITLGKAFEARTLVR